MAENDVGRVGRLLRDTIRLVEALRTAPDLADLDPRILPDVAQVVLNTGWASPSMFEAMEDRAREAEAELAFRDTPEHG